MKKLILFFSVLLIVLISCNSNQSEFNPELEKEKIHKTLTEFFQSLASRDWDKYRTLTTEDMILIEHGLVWNTDSLINAVDLVWADYELNYSFDFIKTYVDENSAWTVYRNQGIAVSEDKEVHFDWVETVIFIKENEKWKIIEAQSTLTKDPEVIEKTKE